MKWQVFIIKGAVEAANSQLQSSLLSYLLKIIFVPVAHSSVRLTFIQSNTIWSTIHARGSLHRVPLGKLSPAVAYLVMCAEVLVLLYHLQLFASPHQNCPHPTSCQVGVQLGRKYIDPSWRQSLEKQADRQRKRLIWVKLQRFCALGTKTQYEARHLKYLFIILDIWTLES